MRFPGIHFPSVTDHDPILYVFGRGYLPVESLESRKKSDLSDKIRIKDEIYALRGGAFCRKRCERKVF